MDIEQKQWAAYGQILLAAVLWGVTGLFNRTLQAAGLSPYAVVAIRNIGSLLVLWILFAFRDRSVFRVKLRHLPYFFGTGIVSVLVFTICYFSCQKLCSLAVAGILLYTAPSIVVIFSAILWKEPITKRKLAALAVTLVGCACVTGIFSGSLTASAAGILLGLGSGLFYALYSVFGHYALEKGYSSATVTVWTFFFAGLGSLAFIRPGEYAAAMAGIVPVLCALGLIIVSTVLPYLLYTAGLSKVETGKASIMTSVEPVAAAVVGVAAFHEQLGPVTILGILCVLAGIYILK